MAEFVMRELVRRAGAQEDVLVDSAATSREELGNDVHPGTRRVLEREGIPCGHHRSRQMGPADYGRFDYLVGMDAENLAGMYRLLLGERGYGWSWDPVSPGEARRADPDGKVSLLMDWTGASRDVADPWYTGDFDATFRDVCAGCSAMLWELLGNDAR
jgi:protein-tyrosine phosphatase